MKITSFQLTIQQDVDEQGYGDNFYIGIDDKGMTTISRPYKSIPVEEQLAIEEVITSAIKAHLKLVKQVDNANKDLRLEEYRPIESVAESAAEESVKSAASQPSHGGSDPTDLVAHSEAEQERLDMEEELYKEAEVETGDAPFEEAETGSDKA